MKSKMKYCGVHDRVYTVICKECYNLELQRTKRNKGDFRHFENVKPAICNAKACYNLAFWKHKGLDIVICEECYKKIDFQKNFELIKTRKME